jgi:hypothetical protein
MLFTYIGHPYREDDFLQKHFPTSLSYSQDQSKQEKLPR